MKSEYKLQNQRALNELAAFIDKVGVMSRRRNLWRIHSELSRTSPSGSSRATNRTGFVGVKEIKGGRYTSKVRIQRRDKYLGTYATPEDAYRARALFLAKLD